MTLNGAIMQLVELSEHPRMSVIFRPAIQKVIETISELEEKPEPHWIPCSERLPDKDGVYEVTCKSQDGIYTARSQYSKDGRFYESYGTHTGYHKWAKLYDENGYDIEITAWMPLPEPYKEDADE